LRRQVPLTLIASVILLGLLTLLLAFGYTTLALPFRQPALPAVTGVAPALTVTPGSLEKDFSSPKTLLAAWPSPEAAQDAAFITITRTPPPPPDPTSTLTATAVASQTVITTTLFPGLDTVPIEHVVLISVDGLRPDALEQANTPVLDALQSQGAYSPSAQAVLPSVTLINHASMLSGMGPDKHGITWNDKELELGLIDGPTLFSVAHDAGLSTAMVVGKPKLEHLVLPGSVETYIYAGFLDRQVISQTLPVIQAGLPNILFIHLPDVDSAGHATGWMSAGQLLAISNTDGLIGEVVAALEAGGYLDSTLLIITADHGGIGQRHGSAALEDTMVPWLAAGPGVPAGLTISQEIITYDTAATILYAFRLPLPPEWDGRPVLEIFQ
jgi:hypothetical protein